MGSRFTEWMSEPAVALLKEEIAGSIAAESSTRHGALCLKWEHLINILLETSRIYIIITEQVMCCGSVFVTLNDRCR